MQGSSGTTDQIAAAGGEATSTIMDTSLADDARRLVQLALDRFGRLDVLVNNAAIDAPDGNAWDLPDSEWRRTIDVNLTGVFFCSRAALEPMLSQGSGAIVNISSQSARVGAKGLSPAYNASKAGVLGLTMSLSAQVADRGVRVNAIMPGLILSRDFGWTPEELEANTRPYALGPGAPRDVAEAVRYLASPAARWVSGTALQITGGYQR
jgi:3-oxoacyl-[acyl-carrier protein] reductase